MLTDTEKLLKVHLNLSEDFFDAIRDDSTSSVGIPSAIGYSNPAVLFNTFGSNYILLRIGEYDKLYTMMSNTISILRSFGDPMSTSIADSITLLTLPKNQRFIDSILQSNGLAKFASYINLYAELAVLILHRPLSTDNLQDYKLQGMC